ncbi:Gfo/Idh/MocA family protein [Lysinibacter cavernae]|uniref:Putative dehydrogenase n=1 Tax=Lysinibacter cavernae TaxID=1640652 RepID=A0A7X5TUE9_9MICO|nr:Gfo/Idh/MocA family oxidoreductase [Lysinibacter cavernae]NIH53512.1 putative dehydrogenase [Lysinibacter cavernae]
MMTLRLGIVGCGNIAANHAIALAQTPGAVVVGCCDSNLARAQEFAAAHNIPHAVATTDELFALGLNAVTVCTPHPVHEEVVVAAASAGLHVLCEKPIAVDLAAADRMIAAADTAGVTFGVLFQRRFWPAAQRIRAAIDDGRIGQPILGEVTVQLFRETEYYSADAWRGSWLTDGGGVLMTQAVHQIDLLQWFLGEPVSVSGFIATQKFGAHIETEDSAVATVRFASGAIASINASTVSNLNLGNRVSVTGTSGAVASLTEFPEGNEAVNDVWTVEGETEFTQVYNAHTRANIPLSQINGQLTPFHTLQIQDFVSAIKEGREPAVTGRDARASLAIIAAVYESARTGTVIALTPSPAPLAESSISA